MSQPDLMLLSSDHTRRILSRIDRTLRWRCSHAPARPLIRSTRGRIPILRLGGWAKHSDHRSSR
jgi:hypothetical protein